MHAPTHAEGFGCHARNAAHWLYPAFDKRSVTHTQSPLSELQAAPRRGRHLSSAERAARRRDRTLLQMRRPLARAIPAPVTPLKGPDPSETGRPHAPKHQATHRPRNMLCARARRECCAPSPSRALKPLCGAADHANSCGAMLRAAWPLCNRGPRLAGVERSAGGGGRARAGLCDQLWHRKLLARLDTRILRESALSLLSAESQISAASALR